MSIFSERLREYRKKAGITQKEVAIQVGMSPPGYTKIEQGQREPNLNTLTMISTVLDVTVDYLLGLTDHPLVNKSLPDPKDASIVQRNVTVVDGLEIEVIVRRKEKSPIPCQED